MSNYKNEVDLLRTELETTRNTNLACVQRMQKEIDRLTKELETSEEGRRFWLQRDSDREDMSDYHDDRMIAATGGL